MREWDGDFLLQQSTKLYQIEGEHFWLVFQENYSTGQFMEVCLIFWIVVIVISQLHI